MTWDRAYEVTNQGSLPHTLHAINTDEKGRSGSTRGRIFQSVEMKIFYDEWNAMRICFFKFHLLVDQKFNLLRVPCKLTVAGVNFRSSSTIIFTKH